MVTETRHVLDVHINIYTQMRTFEKLLMEQFQLANAGFKSLHYSEKLDA